MCKPLLQLTALEFLSSAMHSHTGFMTGLSWQALASWAPLAGALLCTQKSAAHIASNGAKPGTPAYTGSITRSLRVCWSARIGNQLLSPLSRLTQEFIGELCVAGSPCRDNRPRQEREQLDSPLATLLPGA
jgi:hypothetical protein